MRHRVSFCRNDPTWADPRSRMARNKSKLGHMATVKLCVPFRVSCGDVCLYNRLSENVDSDQSAFTIHVTHVSM